MNAGPSPVLFLGLPVGWIALVLLLSTRNRKAAGRPIVPSVPANARYAERAASSGVAKNCVIVAVTPDALVVIPRFPFNLLFLPEIYRLEHSIPLRSIREARAASDGRGSNVVVRYGERGHKLRLRVRNPQAFLTALNRPLPT